MRFDSGRRGQYNEYILAEGALQPHMTYSGRFTITRQDNIQYNFFKIKRKLIGIGLMTFVILAVMLALIRYAQDVPLTSSLVSALIVAFVGTVLMVGVNAASVVLRVGKLYKEGKMSDFSVHYVVDKTGIHVKSERGDTDFAWKHIQLARETRHAIYLLAGQNRTVVIPKEQIADGELNTLRALLHKYVPSGRAKIAG